MLVSYIGGPVCQPNVGSCGASSRAWPTSENVEVARSRCDSLRGRLPNCGRAMAASAQAIEHTQAPARNEHLFKYTHLLTRFAIASPSSHTMRTLIFEAEHGSFSAQIRQRPCFSRSFVQCGSQR